MLRQQQDHVVELVHSRTADIVAMRDKAIAASEAKSAFLSKMSHELRIPLTNIMGYSEIVIDEMEQSGNKGKNVIKDLKKIKLSGQHLLNIIKDILDITRLDSGDAKVEMQTFLFSDVLDYVMRAIEPFAQENHNLLEVENELLSTTMETDRFHLQEAMLQVLKNACKYTEHGKITVHIYSEHNKNKDWLVCVVTDTGIGMTFAQQEQLFQQFSMNEQSMPQRGDGIALGLVIGRAYCRIMGGDISFKSEIGKGSEFTIRLPVCLPQSQQPTGTI
jgi:signal transduction histidine kinase